MQIAPYEELLEKILTGDEGELLLYMRLYESSDCNGCVPNAETRRITEKLGKNEFWRHKNIKALVARGLVDIIPCDGKGACSLSYRTSAKDDGSLQVLLDEALRRSGRIYPIASTNATYASCGAPYPIVPCDASYNVARMLQVY